MNNNFGIMQGRLLPKFKGQYQAHPVGYWHEEYKIANELSIKYIEFIFDLYLYQHNPIFSDLNQIIKIENHTGIKTKSICADFFMNAPIQKANKDELIIFREILIRLIINLSKLNGTDIVIPFVDNSKIENEDDMKMIIEFLNSIEHICNDYNINLSLETDLKPSTLYDFINKFENKYITINYDSGNSASLGYSIEEEFNLFSNKISNIHIKDRILNGGPIELGKGVANLKYLKEFINKNNFNGIITFQAFRDNEGISIFKKKYNYFLNL